MAKVSIIMGSDSDLEVMSKAAKILEEFEIEYEIKIISAHRQPDVLLEYMANLEERGFAVVIAGAGKAAALPGMCAALTPLPVIGIPMKTSDLGGVDSLYSIVQMPSGVPVATVAIGGALNAGILAAKIIGVSDKSVMDKVKKYAADLKDEVNAKGEKLKQLGYKAYLEQK